MLLLLSFIAEAQQPKKIPRIGLLSGGGLSVESNTALLQGLWNLGYVEGKNILIERRLADGKRDRVPAPAAELVTEDRREAVKQRLREDVLRGGTDRPFTLRAKAWAASIRPREFSFRGNIIRRRKLRPPSCVSKIIFGELMKLITSQELLQRLTLYRIQLGYPLPIGIGLAMALPERQVIVSDEDGSLLLGLGALATLLMKTRKILG
jgi:hypothetical protein